jgi:hypothetical protein
MVEETREFPLVRRVKPVQSREVDPAQVAILPPPVIDIPAHRPAPIADAPDAAPVLDPTSYSRRHRKHHHQTLYRIARLAIAASFGSSIAAVVCVSLGDRAVAQTLASIAIASGILAIFVSWPTQLSARVLGYAVASVVLASICFAAISLLPRDWFEDHPTSPQLEPSTPRRTPGEASS